MGRRFTDEERVRIWDMHEAGVPVKRIARMMGRQNASLRALVSQSGGVRPRPRVICERHLSLAERQEISRGLAAGRSFRSIADELNRAPSTLCREVKPNGRRRRYRAVVAEVQLGSVPGAPRWPGWRGAGTSGPQRSQAGCSVVAPGDLGAGWRGPIRTTPR